MINTQAIEIFRQLQGMIPILGDSTTRKDYEDALAMIEQLMETDPDSVLVEILAAGIRRYEDTAPEFAEFNERIAQGSTGIAVLRTLMDQHGLKQSDLAYEIGQRSLVSRVLNGERTLTLEHMRRLAKRFNVPVSIFIDD